MKKKQQKKGAYKSITFIIDKGKKNISYADRKGNKYSYTKRSSGIVSLVSEDLLQVYCKTTHRLIRFHLRRERERGERMRQIVVRKQKR